MVLDAIYKLSDGYSSMIRKSMGETNIFNKTLEKTSKEAGVLKGKLDEIAQAKAGIANLTKGFTTLKSTITKVKSIMKKMNISDLMLRSDEIVNSNTRLSMLTSSLSEQKNLQEKVMQSAKSTRISYSEMARAAINMKTLSGNSFKTNEEALGFTDLLTKSLKLTGAGKGEQEDIFSQITASMASGGLQGDDIKTLTENVPMLAEAISKYMGVPSEKLAELATQGAITSDVIKNAMFMASDDINARFEAMPRTFSDIGMIIQNNFTDAFSKVSENLSKTLSSEGFTDFLNMIRIGIDGFVGAIGIIASVFGFLIDNINILLPLMFSLIAAWLVYNSVSGIAYLTTIKNVVALMLKKSADIAETIAIVALEWAQYGFNAALALCPIMWVVGAFIVLIGVIYAIVAAINKFAEISLSATGIIIGSIATLCTFGFNSIISIWNYIAAFVNFFANVFTDPIVSIEMLFLDLAKNAIGTVLYMIKTIESLINKIPGVNINISDGIYNVMDAIENKIKANSSYKKVLPEFKTKSTQEMFSMGYNLGNGIDKKVASIFESKDKSYLDYTGLDNNFGLSQYSTPQYSTPQYDTPEYGSTANPTTVKGSGKGGAVKVENSEDLDLLRKLATRDYIARVSQNTLAPNIRIDFSGPITKEADTDLVIGHINKTLTEIMATATEG